MLGRFIASSFSGQCFSVGQVCQESCASQITFAVQDFLIDFQGNSLTLRVTELEVVDRDTGGRVILTLRLEDLERRCPADRGEDAADQGG